ncbi:hypothetical protein [Litoribacillus peritrichatus]|uniref:Uncharacterized protein n=1 Tax=Litoribacillus peritrichatus TaxID=718191 RepID=A0ABP7MWR8_9GAMM
MDRNNKNNTFEQLSNSPDKGLSTIEEISDTLISEIWGESIKVDNQQQSSETMPIKTFAPTDQENPSPDI